MFVHPLSLFFIGQTASQTKFGVFVEPEKKKLANIAGS